MPWAKHPSSYNKTPVFAVGTSVFWPRHSTQHPLLHQCGRVDEFITLNKSLQLRYGIHKLSIAIEYRNIVDSNNNCKSYIYISSAKIYQQQQCISEISFAIGHKGVSCDTCTRWHQLLCIKRLSFSIVQQNNCQLQKLNTKVVKY